MSFIFCRNRKSRYYVGELKEKRVVIFVDYMIKYKIISKDVLLVFE